MIKEFTDILSQFSFLRPSDVKKLVGIAQLKRYKKGDVVIAAGSRDKNLYLTVKGFFRTYVVRSDGEERTVYLAGPGMGFGSTKSVYRDELGNETVEALENSMAICWDFVELMNACEESPRLCKLYNKLLERNLLEAVERLEFHSVMNPDQRYEYLLKNRPELMKSVPLKYIASYIGITPVSLSRLRARIAKPS
jgi:CRP-like cAMP-binding protein